MGSQVHSKVHASCQKTHFNATARTAIQLLERWLMDFEKFANTSAWRITSKIQECKKLLNSNRNLQEVVHFCKNNNASVMKLNKEVI